MPNILVFEDLQVEQLFPITTGRPAFAINVATYRLFDLVARIQGNHTAFVRPHLRELVRLDYSEFQDRLGSEDFTLVLNARLVPILSNVAHLREIASSPEAVVVFDNQQLVAAWVPTQSLSRLNFSADLITFNDQLLAAVSSVRKVTSAMRLLSYPHEVIASHLSGFSENLQDRIGRGNYREISDGVFVSESAKISDFVVTNSRSGPIVIESDTVIGPFCFLRGPVFVGANSRVNEHASIKDCVYVGHTAKIGGEVEGSVVESYSNKQHHGFLGHSYLGNWINLGAGTCNSDLKNTYGEVKMDYLGGKTSTGMQFVGCFIGDYSKTAINTSIFTGKIIGVCSMVYGFVTTNVPSFVNYARSFGQVTESPASVMVATQKRMFSRRNVHQRPVDIQLLYDMYELTRRERQLSEEPLSL
jgi:glucose-1-phosphate thymidylyltransferase